MATLWSPKGMGGQYRMVGEGMCYGHDHIKLQQRLNFFIKCVKESHYFVGLNQIKSLCYDQKITSFCMHDASPLCFLPGNREG